MTVNLATSNSAQLFRLFQVFDAESLDEGDMAAGANVLAAKCIALAVPAACTAACESAGCVALGAGE